MSFALARKPIENQLQRNCACGGTPGPTSECEAGRWKMLSRQCKSGNAELRSENNDFSVPRIVHQVLRSPGQPLDEDTRFFMEPRFGHDFSHVRIHTDQQAADSARAVHALAYTVGDHIAFSSDQFAPQTPAGQKLLAHELVHTIQQGGYSLGQPLQILDPSSSLETAADTAARSYVTGGNQSEIPVSDRAAIARQPETRAESSTEGEQGTEPLAKAGTLVSEIVIDLRRGRVGFAVAPPTGFILGSVSTDLKPGEYSVTPDFNKQQWIFERGQVKSGLRFHVELEGADPWSLSYPEKVPVKVGFSTEKKGGGPAGKTAADAAADLLRIWDEAPGGNIPEDPSIDGFVDFIYDPKITEGTGNFSPLVILRYIDGSEEQISIDAIGEDTERPAESAETGKTATGRTVPAKLNCATTPNLCSTKKAIKRTQELLRQKWDAELLNEEFKSFPQVFSVIAQVAMIGSNARAFEVTGKPVNARGTLRRATGEAAGAVEKVKPLNGTVNVGGGLEEGAEQVTNLNPFKPGTGGPTKGIPNHVKAGFEEMDQVFEPGSVQKIISRKLPSNTVDWPRSAQAAAKVMAPGGKVRLNVWQHGSQDSAAIKEAFEKAGFKNVKVLGEGSSVVLADF